MLHKKYHIAYEAFSSAPVHRDRDSQFQTFLLPLHVRPTFLISNWLANSGAMMCGKVNTIVVKFVDSTARDIRPGTPKDMILVSFNPERHRLSVDAYTWAELLLTLNDSVRHIFMSHPPHAQRQVAIWSSLRSAKHVKKQQEVSDSNRD